MVKVNLTKKQVEVLNEIANNYAGYGGTSELNDDEWDDIANRFSKSLIKDVERIKGG